MKDVRRAPVGKAGRPLVGGGGGKGNSLRVLSESREDSVSVSSKALILWSTTLSRFRGPKGALTGGATDLRPIEAERSSADGVTSATGASP